MNRADFLKQFGIGASGLLLPKTMLEKKPIKIYNNYLRGLYYYDYQNFKNRIELGGQVSLDRIKDNLYDHFAVEVRFGKAKLGYLPAYENIVIANMLDQGVELQAFVSKHDPSAHDNALAIEVFADLISTNSNFISKLEQLPADDKEDVYRTGGFEL